MTTSLAEEFTQTSKILFGQKSLQTTLIQIFFYKETITHNTKAQIFCTEFLLSVATFRSDVIEMNLIRMILLESLIKYSL